MFKGKSALLRITPDGMYFVSFAVITAAMVYKPEYIKRYNGNWARWHSTSVSHQAADRKYIEGIRPRIVNSFKDPQ
jgi:hypothetical protein